VRSLPTLCIALGCAVLSLFAPASVLGEDKRSSDVAAVAELIDKHIAADWQTHKVKPAESCSDATLPRLPRPDRMHSPDPNSARFSG
jgi:hypothetical protein